MATGNLAGSPQQNKHTAVQGGGGSRDVGEGSRGVGGGSGGVGGGSRGVGGGDPAV